MRYALIVGILLIAGWCAFCQILAACDIRIGIAQTVRTHNLIDAEQLSYRGESPVLIVVGSSLAGRLEMPRQESRGDYFALSLAGTSPATGLKIVADLVSAGRLGRLKTVVVETDMLGSRDDNEVHDLTFAWPMSVIRRYVAGLRFEYQPLNVLFFAINQLRHKSSADTGYAIGDPKIANAAREKLSELNRMPPPEEAVSPLDAPIATLHRGGIRIVFLNIPTHPIIERSARMLAIRNALKARFPQDRILALDLKQPIMLADGFHLTMASGAAVRDRLIAALK